MILLAVLVLGALALTPSDQRGQRGLWNLLEFWPFRVLLVAMFAYGFVVGGIGYLLRQS